MNRGGFRAPPPRRATVPLKPLADPVVVRDTIERTECAPITTAESTRVSYADRPRDFHFMGFVRTMPCAVLVDPPPGVVVTPCRLPMEADHQGDHATSHKAPDDTCVAMCDGHHDERTDHRGTFSELPLDVEREWRYRQIARTRLEYARLGKSSSFDY